LTVWYQINRINIQYHKIMQETPGFPRWSAYFNNNQADQADYPLLQGLDNELILQRYNTLTMGSSRTRPAFPYWVLRLIIVDCSCLVA
jgi:hypothetical protein